MRVPPYSFLIIVLMFTSCVNTESNEETKEDGFTSEGKEANINQAETYNLISVEIGTYKKEITISDDHLYGKFFGDRAEFYIVENPELFVSSSPVDRLTLYFIDSVLCKKKYELTQDINPELIKSYGGFKFKALNEATKIKSKKEKIVLKSDGGSYINSHLTHYQMRWNESEVALKYIVRTDSSIAQYHLIEELNAYKKLFRMAEMRR